MYKLSLFDWYFIRFSVSIVGTVGTVVKMGRVGSVSTVHYVYVVHYYFRLCNVRCAMCNVPCAMCNVQCAMCKLENIAHVGSCRNLKILLKKFVHACVVNVIHGSVL